VLTPSFLYFNLSIHIYIKTKTIQQLRILVKQFTFEKNLRNIKHAKRFLIVDLKEFIYISS